MSTKLNTRPDGPHAFSDAEEVQCWNETQWLIEYVESNNEMNDSSWDVWGDAREIVSAFSWPQEDDDGRKVEKVATPGDRGQGILEAAIRGEDYETLMNAWSDEIQAAA